MNTFFLLIISLLAWPAAAQEWQFAGQAPSAEQTKHWQQQAAKQGKDLMLVLGANWCHDSTALLERFNQSPFRDQLKQQYQIHS